ncbi:MAG TPA: PEP-CTERM sorting domain-containing protein [Myxococcota bacterium]|nr:PEP-CTERM sorting domain-containing protein [Myxococcota bacterium]
MNRGRTRSPRLALRWLLSIGLVAAGSAAAAAPILLEPTLMWSSLPSFPEIVVGDATLAYDLSSSGIELSATSQRLLDEPTPNNDLVQFGFLFSVDAKATITLDWSRQFLPGQTLAFFQVAEAGTNQRPWDVRLGYRLDSVTSEGPPGSGMAVFSIQPGTYSLIGSVQSPWPLLDPGSSLMLQMTAAPIPEPTAVAGFLAGLGLVGVARRRMRARGC